MSQNPNAVCLTSIGSRSDRATASLAPCRAEFSTSNRTIASPCVDTRHQLTCQTCHLPSLNDSNVPIHICPRQPECKLLSEQLFVKMALLACRKDLATRHTLATPLVPHVIQIQPCWCCNFPPAGNLVTCPVRSAEISPWNQQVSLAQNSDPTWPCILIALHRHPTTHMQDRPRLSPPLDSGTGCNPGNLSFQSLFYSVLVA